MKRLVEQRYVVRHNFLTIMAFCLCFYFTYHIFFGERSIIRLISLERSTARISAEYNSLYQDRQELEARVVRLRPNSLDRDLLEERARFVLGYSYPDETILVGTN